MIRAVIFDMDGVLINTDQIDNRVWASFFALHGVHISETEAKRLSGKRAVDIIKTYLPDVSDAEMEKLRDERRRLFYAELQRTSPDLVPGAEKFIAQLKKKGVPIALATSASRKTAEFTLDHTTLMGNFDVIVTAEDVKNGKPDPEIYITTAKQLGVEPNECVVFEDAPSGVAAARVAGMHVVGLLTTRSADELADTDSSFNNFNEMDIEKILTDL